MYKLEQNKNKELTLTSKYGIESIHVNHLSDNIEDIKQDVANIYIVAEECTNFARVHLISDFSEDEALQQIDEYLRENEGVDESHLIGIFEVEVK